MEYFTVKKLVVTFDENANIPSLKFNMEQDVPELKNKQYSTYKT